MLLVVCVCGFLAQGQAQAGRKLKLEDLRLTPTQRKQLQQLIQEEKVQQLMRQRRLQLILTPEQLKKLHEYRKSRPLLNDSLNNKNEP